MTLLNDILKWTESLPQWQRDACRRLFQMEGRLEELDYDELYLLLRKEKGLKIDVPLEPEPLTNDHLPVEQAPGETVTLNGLRDLKNVNRIPNGNAIVFSETGVTVIYGGNGSGKSGYARVIKRACRARDQAEPIHPDADDPAAANKEPAGKFDIKVGGVPREIEWSRDATPPDSLSSISVFDSKCARSYITAEQDVAYLPYGLDIVESLANQVLPRLTEKLETDIKAIDVSKLPYEHLLGETAVGKVLKELSPESDEDEITSLGTLSEDEIKRIKALETTLHEVDPLAKAEESRLSAVRLKSFAEKLERPLVWVSVEAVEKLQRLTEEKFAAEDAEKAAADVLRSGEQLLPGTGDQAWKALFNAARRYSMEAAYPDEVFPQSIEGQACPLCQESMPKSAITRLERFDRYIQDDVSKAADVARKKLETAKGKIETADLYIAAEAALSDELKALDDSIHQAIDDFQESIEARRLSMLESLSKNNWIDITALAGSPRARVRQLAARQLRTYRRLVRAADEAKRKRLEKEFSELVARKNLSTCSGSMIPDANVGGKIATINEVSDDQKATFFFS